MLSHLWVDGVQVAGLGRQLLSLRRHGSSAGTASLLQAGAVRTSAKARTALPTQPQVLLPLPRDDDDKHIKRGTLCNNTISRGKAYIYRLWQG